jgi:hypothetical protein
MEGPREEERADHGQEDHQGRLGQCEEAAALLFGGNVLFRRCGGVIPGGIEHLGQMMTQPAECS